MDLERRLVLNAGAYSLAALAVPADRWWRDMAAQGRQRQRPGAPLIGAADVDAVTEMIQLFSKADQKRGGGHARTAVVQYLTFDVAPALHGRFATEQVRQRMFTAAGELAYLSGWMAFDNAEHRLAQLYFTQALKLAAEAGDAPLQGHILRAMAHQALDLGHYRAGHDLAASAMERHRYGAASPRERALIAVVHARSLAAAGQSSAAATALITAEDDLASAPPAGEGEPQRVFFFGEASLAHQTACTLREAGDVRGAAQQFRRSVRTRKTGSFTRTHAVTLGHLGAIQARLGAIEEACATWGRALDFMAGVRSGRTRKVVADMRVALSPYRRRGIPAAVELYARSAQYRT